MSDTKCLNKSCTLTSDSERMVTCWLCHGLCHIKCSGLKVLVAEALVNTKGLHWCCNGCQKIGVEFYRFFQSTKNTFINIQNKMTVLSDEIAAYGNLFENFKQLNNLESPQSSPKRRKSSRNKNKGNMEPANTPNTILLPPENASTYTIDLITEENLSNHGAPSPAAESTVPVPFNQNSNFNNVIPNQQNCLTATEKIVPDPFTYVPENSQQNFLPPNRPTCNFNTVIANQQNFVPATEKIVPDPRTYVPENMSFNNVIHNQQNILPPNRPTGNFNNVTHNQQNCLPPNRPTGNLLRVIPPPKEIFVSRFAFETTAEDIEYYIKSKFNSNVNISTQKFVYLKARAITSFKITVPVELFEQILDPSFWPVSTYVREYQQRENQRRIVRLPLHEPNRPKN